MRQGCPQNERTKRIWGIKASTLNLSGFKIAELLVKTHRSSLKLLESKIQSCLKKHSMPKVIQDKTVKIPTKVDLGRSLITEIGLSQIEFHIFWLSRLEQYLVYETTVEIYFHLRSPADIESVFTFGDHRIHELKSDDDDAMESKMAIKLFKTCTNGGERMGYLMSMSDTHAEIHFEGKYENELIALEPEPERESESRPLSIRGCDTTALVLVYSKVKNHLTIIWDRYTSVDKRIDFNLTS